MSAHVIALPIRAKCRRKAPVQVDMRLRLNLELAIFDKLTAAARKSNSSPEMMAEALIVWGLASIEKKSPEEFYDAVMPAKVLSL